MGALREKALQFSNRFGMYGCRPRGKNTPGKKQKQQQQQQKQSESRQLFLDEHARLRPRKS